MVVVVFCLFFLFCACVCCVCTGCLLTTHIYNTPSPTPSTPLPTAPPYIPTYTPTYTLPIQILESLPLLHTSMQWKHRHTQQLEQRSNPTHRTDGIGEDEGASMMHSEDGVEQGIAFFYAALYVRLCNLLCGFFKGVLGWMCSCGE